MTETNTAIASTSLTDSQRKFLEQCETLFKNRYTEEDEEFMAVHTAEPCEPPIMPFHSRRPFERGTRYDNRHNKRRNDDNRYGGRSNRDDWYRQRQDWKRPYDPSSRDYDPYSDKRPRFYDYSGEGGRY